MITVNVIHDALARSERVLGVLAVSLIVAWAPVGAQPSVPAAVGATPPAASASGPAAAPAELYFAPPPVPRFMLVPPDRPLTQQEMMQQIQEAQTRSLATQPPANKP